MDYTTARYKIAQQQLRQWKKNRGTSMNCSISTQRPVKIADRIMQQISINNERTMEDLTETKKLLQQMRRQKC